MSAQRTDGRHKPTNNTDVNNGAVNCLGVEVYTKDKGQKHGQKMFSNVHTCQAGFRLFKLTRDMLLFGAHSKCTAQKKDTFIQLH